LCSAHSHWRSRRPVWCSTARRRFVQPLLRHADCRS
jgi:hypothetical protein